MLHWVFPGFQLGGVNKKPREAGTISSVKRGSYKLIFSITFLLQGFELGSEKHVAEAALSKSGAIKLSSSIEGLSLLKTTKVICCFSKNFIWLDHWIENKFVIECCYHIYMYVFKPKVDNP